MAQPTTLARPPITEALINLRASVPGDRSVFFALGRALAGEFPTLHEKRLFEGKIEIKDGIHVQSEVNLPGFGGVQLRNSDQTLYLQFQPDGFTLNNAKAYIGGDQLIEQALKHWQWLLGRVKIKEVSRVTLHYMNRLDLPIEHGAPIEAYFQSPPSLPQGAPQSVAEFISSVTALDESRGGMVTVIQQLKQPRNPGQSHPTIGISVEAFKTGPFGVDPAELRNVLTSLRELKNETFFSLLTERTVNHYQ